MFRMINKRTLLILTGVSMGLCVSPTNAASTTNNIKANISVQNYSWTSFNPELWVNILYIYRPQDYDCDPTLNHTVNCKDFLNEGYKIDEAGQLMLNQSHTFTLDRSKLYVKAAEPIAADLIVPTPSTANCRQTTRKHSLIYIVSTDSFEECVEQLHLRYQRQYFLLKGHYPKSLVLNNFFEFTIYNNISAHGTVIEAWWEID